ncbi:cathelicidin-6-like [Ascaphus truei]|uniref:cathelicidin-6-like n=1 Tax=Ascaphus truei TaxID=8439 RepID=UPI003F5A3B39
MGNTWRALLLLSLAVGQNLWAFPLDSSWSVQARSSIIRAVERYNIAHRDSSMFKLLEVTPGFNLNLSPHPRVLHFTMKETVCPKLEKKVMQDCPFKADGLLKSCSLHAFQGPQTNRVLPVCDTVIQQSSGVSNQTKCKGKKNCKKEDERKKTQGYSGRFSIIASLPVQRLVTQ